MTVFNMIALIFREQEFFKRRTFSLTHKAVFKNVLGISE